MLEIYLDEEVNKVVSCLQTVVLKVGMSCKGCVGAVERAIAKMDGEKLPFSFLLSLLCRFGESKKDGKSCPSPFPC